MWFNVLLPPRYAIDEQWNDNADDACECKIGDTGTLVDNGDCGCDLECGLTGVEYILVIMNKN
jgi:hypothetical protein